MGAVTIDDIDFPSTERPFGKPHSDPDARVGYRRATATRSEGMFSGYGVHIAVVVPEFASRGFNRSGTLGESVPPFIVGLSVQPADTGPADGGMAATMMARCVAPATDEVVAAFPYTSQAKSFNRPLHVDGTNVVNGPPASVPRAAQARASQRRPTKRSCTAALCCTH